METINWVIDSRRSIDFGYHEVQVPYLVNESSSEYVKAKKL